MTGRKGTIPESEDVSLLGVVGGDLDGGPGEVERRLRAPALLGAGRVRLLVLVERHAPALGHHVHLVPGSVESFMREIGSKKNVQKSVKILNNI